MKIVVPVVSRAFYREDQVSGVKDQLFDVKARFGKIINNVALLLGLTPELLASFIMIESGGRSDLGTNPNSPTGLMQISSPSAKDALWKANREKLVSPQALTYIRSVLGAQRTNCILGMRWMGDTKCKASFTLRELQNPMINILLGAVFLRLLASEEIRPDGTLAIERVVIRYNRGYFAKIQDVGVNQLLATLPSETRNYVLKMAGVRGALDLLTA